MSLPLHQTARHPWNEVFILREYELREGFALDGTSQFCDEVWRLGSAAHQVHLRSVSLSFASIPHRYQLLAKELFCAYLAMPLPDSEDRMGLATVRTELIEIKRFLNWLHDHRGAPRLAELTGGDLASYAKHLRNTLRNPGSPLRSRAALRRIWRFRSALPGDHLRFDPQHVDGWPQTERHRRGENRTDRLPEQVMGPLIVWATRFVDTFAPDILAMTVEWEQLRRNHASIPKGHGQRRPDLLPALEKLLARHLEEQRPLPGRNGRINYAFLANALTANRSSLDRTPAYTQRIDDTAKIVGIAEETYFYTPVLGQLDDGPWLAAISNEYGDGSLPVLSRLLQIACYALISFYSGMRDSEIKHVNRGCLTVERDPDGIAYRWKVHARAFKGERDRKGVPAVWMVGEPAARAIRVLEQLQPAHTEILFQTLPYGVGWAEEHAGRAMGTGTTNVWLNRFARWVNDYCAAHGRLDSIPDVDGRPWPLMTRQFRRTLAWFIARRPGGAIAGALAFRHHAVQMFEGYAGTSESGFRAEVESEQALARGEHLLDLADTHRHDTLAGPGAEEAVRRLEQFGLHTAGFAGNVISDERRLQRLMKHHDPAIYPGTYVTCVYSHDKALCRRASDSTGNALPELSDCKPLTCRNVALTANNVTSWNDELDNIDRQLARRPRLPPLLHHRLDQRRADITAFLGRHTPKEHP